MSDSYKELGTEYLMRDGVSQKQRASKALSPDYVSVEERSPEDVLWSIQKFSERLRFYDLDGTVTDWSSFLTNYLPAGNNEWKEREVIKNRIKEIAYYLEKGILPTSSDILYRPHLALLLCFIKLQSHTRKQINTLTRRHLDFYYTEALGLKNKKAIPDKVNVVIKLGEAESQLMLPAGTRLEAGKDSLGKSLIYTTDNEIVLNKARISALKSLFVEKQVTGVRDVHFQISNPDIAFIQMLQLILAEPWPNDKLPLYPGNKEVNIEFIKGLDNLKKDLAWIDSDLCMSFYDFKFIMQINASNTGNTEQWAKVHAIIEAAGIRKQKNDQFKLLQPTSVKTFYTNLNSTLAPISFAGFSEIDSLDKYYTRKIKQVEDYFNLPALDVAAIMKVRATVKPPDIFHTVNIEWENVYTLLETAYRNKAQKNRAEKLKRQKEVEKESITGSLSDKEKNKKAFEAMFAKALGTISPGQSEPLLSYTLDDLYSDQESIRKQEYITSDLNLDKQEFYAIMEISKSSFSTDLDWERAYALIEKAQRKKNKLQDLPPKREEIFNIYKSEDATTVREPATDDDENTSSAWHLFGMKQGKAPAYSMEPAQIGVAISSPLLLLTQGIRTITATLVFYSSGYNTTSFDDILKNEPFLFYLLNKNGAPQIKAIESTSGYLIVDKAIQEYTGATLSTAKDSITKGQNDLEFVNEDLNKYIVWSDGNIYKITGVEPDKKKVRVSLSGNAGAHTRIKKYDPDSICFKLQFKFNLTEKDSAIEAFEPDGVRLTTWPVLKMVLNNIPNDIAGRSYYQHFRLLQIKEVRLGARVSGMKDFSCQNDESEINPAKPFDPFGNTPRAGSGFYFGHREVAIKRLDDLSLTFNWMGVPDNLQAHYKNYYSTAETNPIVNNSSIKAAVKFNDRRYAISLDNVKLFAGDIRDAQKEYKAVLTDIPNLIHVFSPSYLYEADTNAEGSEDLVDWDRYFKLELNSPDFQHDRYSVASLQKSMELAKDINEKTIKDASAYTVNPPYTPKLKSLSIDYTASEVIRAEAGSTGLYYIHPFGEGLLPREGSGVNFFLPQYNDEGVLYIGLEDAIVGQEVAILFQLAESSANPDLEKPNISWAYMINNHWESFTDRSIVADETHELSNTGITIFNLPENLSDNNTLLEKGKYWIRASVANNSEGVCKAIALHTQAVSATFIDQDNATDHLLVPLPPESITAPESDIPEIESIAQPYTSVNGSTREQDDHFYRRVSERLRHKNRALTMWDYEHIVLENFPDIYKVKCMPAFNPQDAGSVTLVLVPDIVNKLPANPFEPKVSLNRLEEVKRYLQQYTSPGVKLIVKNPRYKVVKVRVGVAFNTGGNEGYFKDLLNKELQKFLAPWAYSEGSEIVLGSKIYANNIVNFIEARPYIDYVVHIKLFSSLDGINFNQVIVSDEEPENAISAGAPDIILVSSKHHEIDLLEGKNYADSNFSGIGYMKVELDFRVG